MKYLHYPVYFCLVLFFFSCDKEAIKSVPPCIKDKILELKNGQVQNPTDEVWEWKTNTQIYYYITSDCCDQFDYLYDSECNIVCAPDGGFTGNGSGDCPIFGADLKKTLIWKDPR